MPRHVWESEDNSSHFLLLYGSWVSNLGPQSCRQVLSHFNRPGVLNFKNMFKLSIIYFDKSKS